MRRPAAIPHRDPNQTAIILLRPSVAGRPRRCEAQPPPFPQGNRPFIFVRKAPANAATPPQNASLLRRRRSYRENWNSALPQAQPHGDRRRHAQGPVGGSAVVPKRRRSSATRPCASAPPSYRRADPRRSAMDGLREAVRQIGTCTLIGARGARDRMRAQRQTASQAPSRSIPSVSPEALSFFRPCRARILGTDHPAPTRPAAL